MAALLCCAALAAIAVSYAYHAHGMGAIFATATLAAVALGSIAAALRLLLVHAASGTAAAAQSAAQIAVISESTLAEAAALAAHLQQIAELERYELARRLHDELGGLLTAAKMDLSWMQSRLEIPPLQERMTQLGGVLDEAMGLKRRVVEELRPSLLEHFGLPTALRAYLEATCANAGLQTRFTIAETIQPLSRESAIALFRIAQEGMTNIIRHAQAHAVIFELADDDRALTLVLGDDGRGFDTAAPRAAEAFGLVGIRQRVHSLGGQLRLESSPRGTTLQVELPTAAAVEAAQAVRAR
jgi:signal transduction histidine kinase